MATKVEVDNITDAWRLGITAAQIEEAAAKSVWQSNPNLLDNWYFGNPVNQRGQTEYSGAGYTIDRWQTSIRAALYVDNGSVKVECISAHNAWTTIFYQFIEANQFVGKTLTLSALCGECSTTTDWWFRLRCGDGSSALLTEAKFVLREGCGSVTIDSVPAGTAIFQVDILPHSVVAGDYLNIIAAKLELGTQQTLAHQDADGNWVLNEIPDYNEELLKCCMSTADSSDTYANNKLTPAAINAVNKAGDIMTAALTVAISDLVHTVSANPASGSRFAYLQFRDTTNRTAANLKFSNTQLAWQVTADMSNWVQYNIFHTGNKPSGSYTGNGSAAARTINTGGIGSALVIWSNAGMCIVTPGGALCKSGASVSAIDTAEVSFVGGVLTIASAEDLVNGAGYTYTYQVL